MHVILSCGETEDGRETGHQKEDEAGLPGEEATDAGPTETTTVPL